jgi:hypothetical protein
MPIENDEYFLVFSLAFDLQDHAPGHAANLGDRAGGCVYMPRPLNTQNGLAFAIFTCHGDQGTPRSRRYE